MWNSFTFFLCLSFFFHTMTFLLTQKKERIYCKSSHVWCEKCCWLEKSNTETLSLRTLIKFDFLLFLWAPWVELCDNDESKRQKISHQLTWHCRLSHLLLLHRWHFIIIITNGCKSLFSVIVWHYQRIRKMKKRRIALYYEWKVVKMNEARWWRNYHHKH